MKPWMGAIAVAIAMVAAPGAAAADDGSSLVRFKLPDKGTVEKLEALGADLDHGLTPAEDGGVIVSALVTPEEQALYEAMGYPAVGTIHGPENADALRAERDKALAEQAAAKAALRNNAAGVKGRSAAAGTIRAQRADYFENYAGRFISIEARDSTGTTTCEVVGGRRVCTYNGPALTAEWLDADGQVKGSGALVHYSDTDIDPAHYLYHVSVFRVGNVGDGGMPASIKVASANGDVDTMPVSEWVSKDGTSSPRGFIQDFITHYVTPRESYAKLRELAYEFPNITQLYDLPEKTNGYQRKAMAIVGTATPYNGGTSNSSVPTAQQGQAVVLNSKAWGHQGGNDLKVQLRNPNGNDKAIAVSVAGDTILVDLATDATGAITSTAAQVVAAINGSEAASALVVASKFRTNAGASVVSPSATATALWDYLKAPTSQPRGPQTVQMLRIGTDRGNSNKVGVFIYCQEHAREWGTPLVCLETAERLVRNYALDPETKALVDGLDIFVVPSINADGATFSMFDNAGQRRNMTNHCAGDPTGPNDPVGRNGWGVDLNRNFTVGSVFDGFVGASATNCTSDTFAGPFELSEPEARNEAWVQTQFPNIKFAMNVHSSGGYFMWPPGAYKPDRTPLPYPPFGTLNYFDETAASVLDRIKSYRGTAILPQRTGPVVDVLYSAAGNSADEAYYRHDIIGYDFEIGANRILADGSEVGVGFQPPFAQPAANQNQNLVNEGHDEGMEFANGNYALLKSALDYANDTTAPVVTAGGETLANEPQSVRFDSDEAATIRYTTDGSEPTDASPEYKPDRPRARPLPVEIGANTTLKWFATDFKGNRSAVKSKTFVIDMVGPTASFSSPAADGATFTQNRPVPLTFTCADENSGVASCVGSPALGSNLDTSTPGTFTYSVTASDNAGNESVVTRSYTVLPATNADGGLNGSVPATLALTLGPAASFGTFLPGVAHEYLASTSATVTSSAADATLSVADPSPTHTGRLVNGAYFLPQALQLRARNATVTNSSYGNVASSAAPLTLLSYTGPVSADAVTLDFRQLIGAGDPLRSGAYGEALTFTLSTTQP